MGVAALCSTLLVFGIALAEQSPPGSVSVGQANAGSLVRGRALAASGPGYRFVRARRENVARFGTDELVAAISRAAKRVAIQAPGATLHVGDLSVEGGGPARGHESHQAGRDVDLLFYVLDEEDEIVRPRAAHFDAAGRADGGLVFDRRRNWLVLRSFLEEENTRLQRVLVSEGLRSLLLEQARQVGEPGWLIERAGEAMCDSWSPHDNHFHVRFYCTAEDYHHGCRDEHPLYPWRRTELAALGIPDPIVKLDPNRSSRRARSWTKRHSGLRPFCP